MSVEVKQRKAMKLESRRLVAAKLQGQVNLVNQNFMFFYFMGFWGRVRWVLFGARVPKQKAQ